MEISNAIDNRLRELCDKQKITISALALQGGLSPTTLLDVRRVKKSPNLKTILKICGALDIRLAEFFDSPDFDSIGFID